ncbi:MAG: hypothetical protein ABIK92_21740 [Pseudomonadota bacterium]
MPAKWIDQLVDRHKDETGFVIGNGWTVNYYNIPALKNEGVLIGCNLGFQKHPLDYIIWQDRNVTDECRRAPCVKLQMMRRNKTPIANGTDTYYWGFGNRNINGALLHNSSGGCALQVLHWMGCNPIILVGCDCMLVPQPGRNEFRSNVFLDKQALLARTDRGCKITVGKQTIRTTKRLLEFAKEFEYWHEKLSQIVKIYKLGNFGTVDIPYIDFPEFWTDEHPGHRKT